MALEVLSSTHGFDLFGCEVWYQNLKLFTHLIEVLNTKFKDRDKHQKIVKNRVVGVIVLSSEYSQLHHEFVKTRNEILCIEDHPDEVFVKICNSSAQRRCLNTLELSDLLKEKLTDRDIVIVHSLELDHSRMDEEIFKHQIQAKRPITEAESEIEHHFGAISAEFCNSLKQKEDQNLLDVTLPSQLLTSWLQCQRTIVSISMNRNVLVDLLNTLVVQDAVNEECLPGKHQFENLLEVCGNSIPASILSETDRNAIQIQSVLIVGINSFATMQKNVLECCRERNIACIKIEKLKREMRKDFTKNMSPITEISFKYYAKQRVPIMPMIEMDVKDPLEEIKYLGHDANFTVLTVSIEKEGDLQKAVMTEHTEDNKEEYCGDILECHIPIFGNTTIEGRPDDVPPSDKTHIGNTQTSEENNDEENLIKKHTSGDMDVTDDLYCKHINFYETYSDMMLLDHPCMGVLYYNDSEVMESCESWWKSVIRQLTDKYTTYSEIEKFLPRHLEKSMQDLSGKVKYIKDVARHIELFRGLVEIEITFIRRQETSDMSFYEKERKQPELGFADMIRNLGTLKKKENYVLLDLDHKNDVDVFFAHLQNDLEDNRDKGESKKRNVLVDTISNDSIKSLKMEHALQTFCNSHRTLQKKSDSEIEKPLALVDYSGYGLKERQLKTDVDVSVFRNQYVDEEQIYHDAQEDEDEEEVYFDIEDCTYSCCNFLPPSGSDKLIVRFSKTVESVSVIENGDGFDMQKCSAGSSSIEREGEKPFPVQPVNCTMDNTDTAHEERNLRSILDNSTSHKKRKRIAGYYSKVGKRHQRFEKVKSSNHCSRFIIALFIYFTTFSSYVMSEEVMGEQLNRFEYKDVGQNDTINMGLLRDNDFIISEAMGYNDSIGRIIKLLPVNVHSLFWKKYDCLFPCIHTIVNTVDQKFNLMWQWSRNHKTAKFYASRVLSRDVINLKPLQIRLLGDSGWMDRYPFIEMDSYSHGYSTETEKKPEIDGKKISMYFELSRVLKPDTFIDLSSLRGFYSTASFKTKKAKQKKEKEEDDSIWDEYTILNMAGYFFIEVVSCLIKFEEASLLNIASHLCYTVLVSLMWFFVLELLKDILIQKENIANGKTTGTEELPVLYFDTYGTMGLMFFWTFLRIELTSAQFLFWGGMCCMLYSMFCFLITQHNLSDCLLCREDWELFKGFLCDGFRKITIFWKKMLEMFKVILIFLFKKLVTWGTRIIEEGFPFSENDECHIENIINEYNNIQADKCIDANVDTIVTQDAVHADHKTCNQRRTSLVKKSNSNTQCGRNSEEHELFSKNKCETSGENDRNIQEDIFDKTGSVNEHSERIDDVTCNFGQRSNDDNKLQYDDKQELATDVDKSFSMNQGKTCLIEEDIGMDVKEEIHVVPWSNENAKKNAIVETLSCIEGGSHQNKMGDMVIAINVDKEKIEERKMKDFIKEDAEMNQANDMKETEITNINGAEITNANGTENENGKCIRKMNGSIDTNVNEIKIEVTNIFEAENINSNGAEFTYKTRVSEVTNENGTCNRNMNKAGDTNMNGIDITKTSGAEITNKSGAEITNISRAAITPKSRAEITNKSGVEITNKSGAEITFKSGAEITNKSGAEITDRSGAEIIDQSGAEITNKSGAVITDQSGAEITDQSGAEITFKSGAEITDITGAEITNIDREDFREINKVGIKNVNEVIICCEERKVEVSKQRAGLKQTQTGNGVQNVCKHHTDLHVDRAHQHSNDVHNKFYNTCTFGTGLNNSYKSSKEHGQVQLKTDADDDKVKGLFLNSFMGNQSRDQDNKHFSVRNSFNLEANYYKKVVDIRKDISSLHSVENDLTSRTEIADIDEETYPKNVISSSRNIVSTRVTTDDLPPLSVDEFCNDEEIGHLTSRGNIVATCTDDNEFECKSAYSSMTSELGSEHAERNEEFNVKLFSHHTEQIPDTSFDRYCPVMDSQVDVSLKEHLSYLKSSSVGDSNSLKDCYESCSGISSDKSLQVYNCQYERHPSFEKPSECTKPINTVIDLQKNEQNKLYELNLEKKDGKKLPVRVLERSENHEVNTSYISNYVRDAMKIVMNDLKKDLFKFDKSSRKRSVCKHRHKSRRPITRRRLRRIIYGGSNFTPEVAIEARPILGGQPNVTSGNITVSESNQLRSAISSASISQSEVGASQLETPSSLKTYFTQKVNGHDFTKEEMMMFEMLRVQSFQDLPASCDASPLRLAASGFFSTGIGDEVICVSCGVKYKNWTWRDNPKEVHRRISPDCRMVNGTETRNIPVHPRTNGHVNGVAAQPESSGHLTNGFVQSTPMYDGAVSTQTANQNGPPYRDEMERPYTADNTRQTQNVVQQPVSAHQFTQPQTDRSNTISETQNQPTQPQRTNTLSDAQSQPAQPQRTNALSGSQNGQPAQRDIAEDLGITLDRPKYPAYAQLNVRMSTFQGWPGYLDQTPRDMALAGFFYAGYNDYCRCFFCGGGLRNWDAGDDPWVEHARWFSKCAFVLQNRGRRFVEIIMRRQAEMQASGNLSSGAKNQTAITAQSETSSRQNDTLTRQTEIPAENASSSQPGNVSAAAIQSVKEMGYSEETIQKAIAQIRQNQPHKETIDATDILNIIFTLTEDNTETNTPVPSENTSASALNLPSTSLPTPQATVAGQQSKSGQPKQAAATKSVTESQSSNAQNAEASLPSLSVSSLEQINKTAEVVAVVAGGNSQMSENDIRSIQEENIQLKEQVMCKICMDKNVSIAFLPCGHLACCIDCAPAMRKCPMCRVFIKGTVKTYLA